MLTKDLPIESMLPRISLSRFFETVNAPRHKPPDRISEVYELSCYLEGDGSIIIGDNTYKINPGDIRFTKPGTFLCSLPHYNCYTIYFDFGERAHLYQNPLLDGIPEYFHTGGEFQKLFEDLVQLFQSKDLLAPVKQNVLLLTLLTQLFENFYSRKKYCETVETCISYMEEHYADDITLDTLGTLTGYSGLHLLRLFKRDTGSTPHTILTSLRMNSAKNMLIYTEKSISEISSVCGFRSDAHFKTLFKKITGFTPGNYRKNAEMI